MPYESNRSTNHMHNPNEFAFGSQKRRRERERLILPAAHELDSSLTEGTHTVRQDDHIKEQKKKMIMKHKSILVLPQQARIIPYIFWNEILCIEVSI